MFMAQTVLTLRPFFNAPSGKKLNVGVLQVNRSVLPIKNLSK